MTSSRLIAILALCLVAILGCGVDASTRTWVERVEAAHRLADAAKDATERDTAREALLELVVAPPPTSVPAEVRLGLRQDLYFRLALLALADAEPARALAQATAGIALGSEPTVFASNLHIAAGAAHEALGDRAAAGESYERSLTISEHLLDQALGEKGPK